MGSQVDTIDGKLAFTLEGAHSRHRVLRAGGDATGSEMVRALSVKAQRLPNLKWMGNHFGMELLIQDGRCWGATVLDEVSGKMKIIKASAVLLVTGGEVRFMPEPQIPRVQPGMGLPWLGGPVPFWRIWNSSNFIPPHSTSPRLHHFSFPKPFEEKEVSYGTIVANGS